MTITPPGFREVAGLQVPLPLVPRIISAFRGTYPELTTGVVDNDAAVRAVLKFWVTQMLSAWEARQAQAPAQQAAQDVIDQYAVDADEARQKAVHDAAGIIEAPTS